ncbi:MAG: hypothetical protein OEY11_15130 [Gammaproteobacteria bacterium]|nr:hypothetical protein [Gammaproteobacteria bacterium]
MTLCTTCTKANNSCPVYPLKTETCVEYIEQDQPCRYCHSTDLSDNTWNIHDKEVDAIECNQCYAGAPKTTWNKPQ